MDNIGKNVISLKIVFIHTHIHFFKKRFHKCVVWFKKYPCINIIYFFILSFNLCSRDSNPGPNTCEVGTLLSLWPSYFLIFLSMFLFWDLAPHLALLKAYFWLHVSNCGHCIPLHCTFIEDVSEKLTFILPLKSHTNSVFRWFSK